MKRAICLILTCLLLCGCGAKDTTFNRTLFCMDTMMDFRIWGSDSTNAANKMADMLEAMEEDWSASSDTSLLAALNDGTADLTQEQAELIAQVEALSVRTGGAFDPRLYAVTELWGFPTDDFHVPTQEEIDAALLERRWDLGAALKGYAGERCVQIMERYDVERALLDLGGNIQTYGSKPDGSPWNIGIRSPFDSGTIGTLSITGTMSIVTSGDYQRYFELDGQRYYHILDPKTGRPADSGLSSVTVVCEDGLTADALSTALFVMGLEEGTRFYQESDDFEAVFILTTGEVYATEGLTLTGCEFQVISHEN
ncbi:MAG: FAD:protein FMN transferase [Oscillospiraceae bacterium]|nr:FAD:protein FMN transferase [Oscillospiraceae bacterium]